MCSNFDTADTAVVPASTSATIALAATGMFAAAYQRHSMATVGMKRAFIMLNTISDDARLSFFIPIMQFVTEMCVRANPHSLVMN